jgi:hypothetical protein
VCEKQGQLRTRVETEEGEGNDALVNEDRVPLAAPDELCERECDGGSADDAHRGLSLLPVWGVLVPERSDHVHEHTRALALDRSRVGTLDKREDLMQPRRPGILALRRQRQIVAITG